MRPMAMRKHQTPSRRQKLLLMLPLLLLLHHAHPQAVAPDGGSMVSNQPNLRLSRILWALWELPRRHQLAPKPFLQRRRRRKLLLLHALLGPRLAPRRPRCAA